MPRVLLVAFREFRQRVRTRGFLLSSLATPVLLLAVWAIGGAFDSSPASAVEPLAKLMQAGLPDRPIGYVDQAGLIRSVPGQVPSGLFLPYADDASAADALARGEIGIYYVVAADYRETGNVRRVSHDLPGLAAPDTGLFDWVLASNLLPDVAPKEVARLQRPLGPSGPAFVALSRAEEPAGEAGDGGLGNMMLPFLVTMAAIIPLYGSATLLLNSLSQEKSGRVMEILLSSLRPRQLLAGKLLGLGAVTSVQYAIWAGVVLVALAVTGRDVTRLLSGVNLTAGELLLVVPFALGGYVLYASLMAGLGALAPNMENSRGWVFVVSLPMMIPIYLWMAISTSPNGALATVLSLIPFSAPVAMMLRMTSTSVPAWQVGASLALLWVAGVGMVGLMARLFRVQTLLSGEALSLRRMWAALRV
jgi:ABC-2 type transport system permease protein